MLLADYAEEGGAEKDCKHVISDNFITGVYFRFMVYINSIQISFSLFFSGN